MARLCMLPGMDSVISKHENIIDSRRRWSRLCPFCGDGSVVVDSLFIFAPIVCMGLCLVSDLLCGTWCPFYF